MVGFGVSLAQQALHDGGRGVLSPTGTDQSQEHFPFPEDDGVAVGGNKNINPVAFHFFTGIEGIIDSGILAGRNFKYRTEGDDVGVDRDGAQLRPGSGSRYPPQAICRGSVLFPVFLGERSHRWNGCRSKVGKRLGNQSGRRQRNSRNRFDGKICLDGNATLQRLRLRLDRTARGNQVKKEDEVCEYDGCQYESFYQYELL